MQFPDGIVAIFICGMSVQADNTATIGGSEGYIEIPVPWKPVHGKGGFVIGHSATPRQDQKNPAAPLAPPGNPCRWMSIKIYTPWRPTISRRRCWMALRRPSPAQTRSETCASSTKCAGRSDCNSDLRRNHHRRGPCRLYRGHSALRGGWSVKLIEQHRFPRDKVCGECLSSTGFDVLERLGLAERFFALSPVELSSANIHSPAGKSLSIALPQSMWGISRMAFDEMLLAAAREAGAAILQPARCERIGPRSSYEIWKITNC